MISIPRPLPSSPRPFRGAPVRIVVVGRDDEAAARTVAAVEAGGRACQPVRAATRQEMLDCLRAPCDLVIGDYADTAFDALAAVRLFRERDQVTPFLLLAERESGPEAIEALRDGATEVIERTRLERLPLAVERALAESRVRAENRRLQQSLQAAEQKLHSVFEQSLDVILIIQGATGTILRANRAAFLHLGYDEEELVGRHFSRLFPPGTEVGPGDLLGRLRVTGPVFESQPFLRADGTVCPMDLTATLLPWGPAQAIVATLREATARQHLEESLSLLQFGADRIPELILWTRPDGRICRANRAACSRLGYAREELASLALSQVDPGLGEAVWPIHWEEVRAFGSFPLRATWRAKDGTPVPIAATVHHLRDGAREYHCVIARGAEAASAAVGEETGAR